ncbi:ATP-binding protein [Streptomyces indicus]|uniref:Histidine kinase-like ATPase domain-containing protein n=1 Tax=Streptomyces indicus TaxID=417292 RepID=A0A1G9EI48_9ACTN|nr:ATP-binding protein [Streptomyces indicus]SDK75820.1 Histidine kinase-like ATPase domain-containing protein [Streptomyces indicus]
MLRRHAFRLPRHPASVGLARLRVREHLAAWGHTGETGAVADTVLLVSELATNAVRHGPVLEREFEVAVTVLADGCCLIEVSDESSAEPILRHDPGPFAEHGRGIRLVDAVAETWGVWQRGRYGKTVWALVGTERRQPGENTAS